MTNMKTRKGFTLIELLVVIAIIGLLSTLAVIALNNARKKSRDAKRVADIKQVQTALEMYFNDKNAYPTCASGATPVAFSGLLDTGAADCAYGIKEFMNGINTLSDPSNTTGACTGTSVATCNYSYSSQYQAVPSTNYAIYFYLEANTGSTVNAGLNRASTKGIEGCPGTPPVCPPL